MDPRIHSLHPPVGIAKSQHQKKKSGSSFQQVLEEAQSLKVSKHAKQRLEQRNIKIHESSWNQITKKINEAREKGVTDSVVVTKDAALVVSTKNRTVVTAMNREEASAQIFTNINGAIFINE